MAFEGLIEGVQDYLFDFFDDSHSSVVGFEEILTVGLETGRNLQELDLANLWELEELIRLALIAGISLVILGITRLANGRVKVLVSTRN